jgi:hypothetical protein
LFLGGFRMGVGENDSPSGVLFVNAGVRFSLTCFDSSPCAVLRRNGFPDIMAISQRMADCLMAAGPRADVDMNNIFMRYAMDVTGLVGFAKDFKVTGSMDDHKTDELFEVLRTGAAHACLHLNKVFTRNPQNLCIFLKAG